MLGVFLVFGQVRGAVAGLGTFLTVYYLFGGNILLGFSYGQVSQIIALIIGFATLPLIQYLCIRFGKHVALNIGLGWMIVGFMFKLVIYYNPEYPELLWLTPIFDGTAVGMFYTVFGTLMGDVTDIDELRNGERREAMFGAVMAVVMKSVSALGAFATGVVVVGGWFRNR